MRPQSSGFGVGRLLAAVAAAVSLHSHTAAAASSVSIRSEPAFKAMRECARDCLVWNGSIDLMGEFGCMWPYPNDCLCRTDLAPAASKHISTCCDTYCTAGPASGDISIAISVYNSYCVANGFDVTAAAVAPPQTTTLATQTRQGGIPSSTNTAATGQQPAANQPASTNSITPTTTPSSSGGSSGLSTGAIIGIVVPLATLLFTALTFGVKFYYARRKAKREEQQPHPEAQRKDSF